MFMRIVAVLCFLACCASQSTSCLAQTNPQQVQRSGPEREVAMLLDGNGQAPIVSMSQKQMSRLGDAAAVGVIEYLGERTMTVSDDRTTPDEIRRMLLILRMAFAAPTVITLEENRVPKASLILLHYLNSLPASKSEKAEIQETSHFIEQIKQTSKTSDQTK